MIALSTGVIRAYLMKRYAKKFDRVIIFISLICCLSLFMPLLGKASDSIADEILSIDVKAQPLGEVLEDISAELGCRFSIHDSWEDFPITASFKNEPLHRGLKKILRKLNNAVIYGSDGTVRIMIYGEILPSATPARHAISEQRFEEAIHQPVSHRRQLSPQTGAQVFEQERDGGPDDSSSEEDQESNPESAETVDDKVAESENEELIEKSELRENVNPSGKDVDRNEETESASDESENKNPGNRELDAESTTN